MYNGKVYELQINESMPIKRGWMSRVYLVFTGMPSDSVYSVAITYTNVHNSCAYNLYIPKSHNEVKLIRGRIIVQRVTSTSISFRIEDTDQHHGKIPL